MLIKTMLKFCMLFLGNFWFWRNLLVSRLRNGIFYILSFMQITNIWIIVNIYFKSSYLKRRPNFGTDGA